MSQTTRMRYPAQALAELKKEDPNTPITVNFIRSLAKKGLIPSIKIGRKYLINFDKLLDYLANDCQIIPESTHGIRRIHE